VQNTFELLICIKCHKHLDFILDTYQSVLKNTNPDMTQITFAVDHNQENLSAELISLFGENRVYTSPYRCGWGGGLFNLILASYQYFTTKFEFKHLITLDYDTIFLAPEVDVKLLSRIQQNTGILGHVYPMYYGIVEPINRTLIPIVEQNGKIDPAYLTKRNFNYTLGCFVLFTDKYLKALSDFGFLNNSWISGTSRIRHREDMFMPLLCESFGLEILPTNDFTSCNVINEKPFGQEKTGISVFHPTKLTPAMTGRENDIEIRNYYRAIRGDLPLS
jgi:hypothetical protein